jgi:hypothetical protein
MSLIEGFASYKPPEDIPLPLDHTIVGMPPGTRLYRIVRLPRGWRLWIATRDYISGTYLELFEDGRVMNCTARADEGEDMFWVRPSDKEIRRVASYL